MPVTSLRIGRFVFLAAARLLDVLPEREPPLLPLREAVLRVPLFPLDVVFFCVVAMVFPSYFIITVKMMVSAPTAQQ